MSRDLQRMQDINAKDWTDAIHAAQKQCKLLKNKDKAWNRYVAARGIGGDKMIAVGRCFFRKACDLGHERAIAFDKVFKARGEHRRTLILNKKRAALRPVLERFAKAVEKRLDGIECRISTMCGYPYWNNEGMFVNFSFLGDDAPYSGYDPSGATFIGNYRRQYLGKNLAKIATITKKFECGLYKSGQDLFVKFPFPKATR